MRQCEIMVFHKDFQRALCCSTFHRDWLPDSLGMIQLNLRNAFHSIVDHAKLPTQTSEDALVVRGPEKHALK